MKSVHTSCLIYQIAYLVGEMTAYFHAIAWVTPTADATKLQEIASTSLVYSLTPQTLGSVMIGLALSAKQVWKDEYPLFSLCFMSNSPEM